MVKQSRFAVLFALIAGCGGGGGSGKKPPSITVGSTVVEEGSSATITAAFRDTLSFVGSEAIPKLEVTHADGETCALEYPEGIQSNVAKYTVKIASGTTQCLLTFTFTDGAAAALTLNVPPPPPGTELVWNGGFDSGLDGWDHYVMNGGNAVYGVVGGEAVVATSSVASDYSGIQLSNNHFPLYSGKTYRFTFRARASTPMTLGTSIWENGHDTSGDGFGWSTYHFEYQAVTTSMATYTVDFTMPVTNGDAGLCFFMGDFLGTVYLDDVSLKELP